MPEFKDARTVWDRRFASTDAMLFGESPNQWLVEHRSRFGQAADLLCVADGEARNGVYLARLGHRVRSFDVSPVAIDKARRFALRQGVEIDLSVSDISQWPFEPDSCDAIVAIFIQFASPDMRSRIFEGMRRALRPGGILLIEGYGPRQLRYRTGGPGIAENLYTVSLLNASFPGWEILASRDADAVLAEGSGHSGLSHLVSAVFRRPGDGDPVVRS